MRVQPGVTSRALGNAAAAERELQHAHFAEVSVHNSDLLPALLKDHLLASASAHDNRRGISIRQSSARAAGTVAAAAALT